MNCPICNIALVISERQGIEIDYCPKCRGVWLDRGELDKIIERASLELSPAHHPQNQVQYRQNGYAPQGSHHEKHHDNHHSKGHYKKKRSILFDLFD